jgi:hypothetical protein
MSRLSSGGKRRRVETGPARILDLKNSLTVEDIASEVKERYEEDRKRGGCELSLVSLLKRLSLAVLEQASQFQAIKAEMKVKMGSPETAARPKAGGDGKDGIEELTDGVHTNEAEFFRRRDLMMVGRFFERRNQG